MANREREGGGRWTLVVALLVSAGCGARTGLRVPRAVGIATGYSTSAAWRDDGRVFVWGRNDDGELGVGDRVDRLAPERWRSVPDAVEIAFGTFWGCARTRNGAVWCWGDRRVGFTTVPTGVLGPSLVEELPPIAQMAIDDAQACGVTYDGWVYCWGFGVGPEYPGSVAWTGRDGGVLVRDVMGAVGVDVGSGHACAWRADGSAACWGINNSGELARGTANPGCVLVGPGRERCYFAAAPVTGVGPIAQMSLGVGNTYALTRDGRVFAWGQLNAISLPLVNPDSVEITLPEPAAQIEVGGNASCARSRTGNVYCWGSGSVTGTYASSVPRLIAGVDGVVDLSVGREHACAVRGDATVWCWGTNREGELGYAPGGPGPDSVWVARRVPEVEGE